MQAHTMSTSHTRRPMPEGAIEQAPYCLLPRRMISDLRDNPLAIGLYLLIARLYLVNQAPIPLGRADVLAFDPSLKPGAVKRAFDRLLMGGWLVGTTAHASTKRHYTPTWGVVGGSIRPWSVDAPALGRPHHLTMVRVNRDLLDIGLGRMSPHPRHAAEISRYLVAPALSLADLGSYALVLAGLGRATPRLTALGLAEDSQVSAVLPASALLQEFAEHDGIELNEQGRRKLGMASAAHQGVIGRRIGGVIGQLIGSSGMDAPARSAMGSGTSSQRPPHRIIQGISSDSSDSPTPPPTLAATGGGLRVLRRRQAERPKPAPVPETEATRLLGAIDVRPAQQIELAGMPSAAVEAAIADGRARGGIRDLAGWVVYLLRQRRDHGWTPPPPAARADAPQVLGAYFAQRAAEQEREQAVEQVDAQSPAASPAKIPPTSTLPTEILATSAPSSTPKTEEPPSLIDLWQDTLAGLRLRLPREVYQVCLRQATLMSCADSVATIGVPDMRTKDILERGYLGALRLALGDAIGHDVAVRVVLRTST